MALQQVGQLSLLKSLLGHVLIPPAVAGETQSLEPFPPYIVRRNLSMPIPPAVSRAELGLGETEAIALASQLHCGLLMDDRRARHVAAFLGLPVMGTVGLILAAKQLGLLGSVRPVLLSLQDHGFRLSPRLMKRVLEETAEA